MATDRLINHTQGNQIIEKLNNIAGNVSYPQLVAPIETTSTASMAHAVGTYFVYNGYLYTTTVAISQGGTIIPNTNCVTTNVGSELTSVKQTLSLINISSAFEFQNDASGTLKVLKSGHLVIVNFDTNLPSSYSGDSPFIFLSTTQYIAESLTFFTAMRGNSGITGTPCRGYIDTAGDIRIYCPAGSSGGIRGSFAYFC